MRKSSSANTMYVGRVAYYCENLSWYLLLFVEFNNGISQSLYNKTSQIYVIRWNWLQINVLKSKGITVNNKLTRFILPHSFYKSQTMQNR